MGRDLASELDELKRNFRSVATLLRDNAAAYPDKTFVHSIDQGKGITYAQTERLGNQMARFFARRRLTANSRVVLLGDNSLEYVLAILGVLRYGATICAINLEMNEVHLRAIIGAVRPDLVLWQAGLGERDYVRSAGERALPFAQWPAKAAGGGEFFAEVAAEPEEPEAGEVSTPEALADIIYTSGTTDRPKGVLHDYNNRFNASFAVNQALGLRASDRILEYRSFGWASAQGFGLMSPLTVGASSYIARRFSQSRFFDWIRDHRITVAVGIPTVINMLVNRTDTAAPVDLSSVRFMTSSTSALLPEQQKKFEATYGVKIAQCYGMSEGGWLAATNPENRKIGSVGQPTLGQDLRVVAADGSDMPAGEIGEIETGGAHMAYGYLNYDGTIETIRHRRLKTGDLGYLDADNFLFITGRSKDLIIRGGVNISPLELEGVLLQHPHIAEAVVIGVPDQIYGEEVACYAVARAGAALTAEEVLGFCAARLPDYKQPKQVYLTDSVPKNERGKIDRAKVLAGWKEAHAATQA